jgi:hypothetical protein
MLLSSQYAVASYACPKLETAGSSMEEMMPNCPMEMERKLSSLCNEHCKQTPQSSQVGTVDIPLFLAITCRTMIYPEIVERTASGAVLACPLRLPSSSPPRRIQFQVFRI